ncbi:mRNA export factor GLE1 isoform X2 [Hevea brasiliensis]|uniref:mRNA export factor GLE1 isoform X2 n=1 Tax=Hevea brasiliensis TaxID=3981 RepID=UPI000B78F6E7|nr:mRNA export factor GLE1 isoform X2 [Hevea brasiliensis]
MGAFKLEIPCPPKVLEIAADPEPDWSFNAVLSELELLEKKLDVSFDKTQYRGFSNRKSVERSPVAFIMRISDDEMEDSESEAEEDHGPSSVAVTRFNCDDIYVSVSDDFDSQIALDGQSYLMDEVGLVEGALFELSPELGVKEDIRNQISTLEMELMRDSGKYDSAFKRVEKYIEARKESDRKFDTQYQRKIAEALDNHLTAIQRDHELKSQIEERRIRSDAAHEEAKRKEKALQEERIRQERAKAEAEAKHKAEEAKMVALEAERKTVQEAARKEAAEASKRVAALVPQGDAARQQVNVSSANQNLHKQGPASNGTRKSEPTADILRAAESALNLEQGRLHKLKKLEEENQSLKLSSNMDFSNSERHIARLIRQIRGTQENIRTKSSELIKIFKNPSCPLSISIAAFAKKVASHCEIPDNAAFACGHVIVLVTSQSAFESKEAYYKTIGYQEQDGKVESTRDYLKRLESYMKLYGALVQTEIQGIQNTHGPKEGWAWLARFLNTLPANVYTAVALKAFLQTAGFVLFKKYKSQFRKMLNIISKDFLKALREREDQELKTIIIEIQSYIEDNRFLQEPEGWSMQSSLLSSVMVPDSEPSRGYYYY